MAALHIDVVTPNGSKYSSDILACTAPGKAGQFQVLTNHAPLLSLINVGEIVIEISDGENRFLSTSGGFLEVINNVINVVVETAEWAEEIDLDRARAAKNRAEDRLSQQEGIDITRAKAALARALNRIKVATRV